MQGVESKQNLVILMTGTVHPNTFKTLALTNADERRLQYIEAIDFYLKETNFKIVFTENSGTCLKNHFLDQDARIEFLTYKTVYSDKTLDLGKGHKELEIIDFAIENSKYIKNANALVKITGRLKILNINSLCDHFMKRLNIHERMFSCNVYKMGKMDARCFFFSLDFWPYLMSLKQQVNIKYSIEKAMWDAAIAYIEDGYSFKQFKLSARIEGINGGFNTSYDTSWKSYVLKTFRLLILKPYYYNKLNN